MYISVLLKLTGGLAMFLYGMYAMGEGIKELAGGEAERVLAGMTAGKLKALSFGTVVTAVLQSSSAVTVMTVSLVNSGIITYTQSVGIIMGANIGTTVTSWLMCLAGIETADIWLSLLMPSTFVPVLGLIGILLILFPKSKNKRLAGNIISGFTTLMTGMSMMSEATIPIAGAEWLGNILTVFCNPVYGLISGAIITAILQSSSASIGILQALCFTGRIRYECVIPLIMGQNIGTCVSVLPSLAGATVQAGRTVKFHFFFNIFGTVVFMMLFYGYNMLYGIDFMHYYADPVGVAIIHTAFNIGTSILLLPFFG